MPLIMHGREGLPSSSSSLLRYGEAEGTEKDSSSLPSTFCYKFLASKKEKIEDVNASLEGHPRRTT